jgi:putative ABC transport system substrate-binding protein
MSPSRREFIVGAAAAIGWASELCAQQPERKRRIGILTSYNENDPEGQAGYVLFTKTLESAGWIEGRNIEFVSSWGFGLENVESRIQYLLKSSPDAILTTTSRMVKPLMRDIKDIPIVFTNVTDPIEQGIVSGLAHPGGNVTGFTNPPFTLDGKSLQMLKEVAPSVTDIALVISADNGAASAHFKAFDTIAPVLGFAGVKLPVQARARDLEASIAAFAHTKSGGLFLPRDVFTEQEHKLVVELADRFRLPAVYANRVFVDVGGLMSYGSSQVDAYRGAALYVDRILRGEKVGDLPVQEPTKFEFVVSLKTARRFGLNVPLPLLAAADEVIE